VTADDVEQSCSTTVETVVEGGLLGSEHFDNSLIIFTQMTSATGR